ncbi:MAG: sigma-70 family RNA polymerase sigma factor [Gemmatimonadaceae bacterium]
MDARIAWNRYAGGDPSAREALLSEHLSLVHHVARQMARGMSVQADFDEMVSAGAIGLINALESFDTGRGLAFSTYAVPRIRGAILDEFRRQDHVPRSVRRKSRELGAAQEALQRQLERAPEEREVAAHLNVDLETLWRWRADVEAAVQVPLERSVTDQDEPGGTVLMLPSTTEENIEDRIIRAEDLARLRGAIRGLKEQERTVLSLYYYEELKLHEIATILELTESRVSQIRSRALARLRQQLSLLGEMAT